MKTDKMELTEYGILAPALRTIDIKKETDKKVIDEWVSSVTQMINDRFSRTKFCQNGYTRVKDFDKESILQLWQKTLTK